MNWTAPIELTATRPALSPARLQGEPHPVLLFRITGDESEVCPVCGRESLRLVHPPLGGEAFGACTMPPPDEVLAALRGWCRSLGLHEAAAVVRRLARRPYRDSPPELAPLVVLFDGETLEGMGARPRSSLADLGEVIGELGHALSPVMTGDEWQRFQERLLDYLWR